LIRNIEWVHSFHRLEDLAEPHPGFYQGASQRMLALVTASPWLPLRQFCSNMEACLGMPASSGLMLFRHLLEHIV